MDDLFPILMVLIFVLGPVIEGLKRKDKGSAPPPPARRPQPPRPPQRVPERPSRTEEISAGTRRQEEAASTMVPDDLWEILTGQKRPSVLTTPQPIPQQEPKRQPWHVVYDPELDEDEEGEKEVVAPEDVLVETRRAREEARSLETYERHLEPIIISLEENIPSVAQRHAAFHKKLAAPAELTMQQPIHPRLPLNSRSELQRAFLLVEVLGRPKGLE